MTPDHELTETRLNLRRLAGARVGRIVYTVGALPAVLPVRYRLDGDGSVVIHAAARSQLVRAVSGALVAFEAGEVAEDGTGWSVTVLGRADVADAHARRAAAEAPVPETLPVTIRIRPELVSGRTLPDADTRVA
ncbi:pyridoxamine 5'-phosphate oxidase family protein [Kitasatospora camelliae]|uniref:Pyridoxamine 5'-phosphate oxidase family protein n=1 Tax=Kitasatospora camelliae TaxID=3156397 RepID=A0AAU8JPE3_9ACTN